MFARADRAIDVVTKQPSSDELAELILTTDLVSYRDSVAYSRRREACAFAAVMGALESELRVLDAQR